MVCCMERYLHTLDDTYDPSLESFQNAIAYLKESRALDRYTLSKLLDELEQQKNLHPYEELMNMNEGGLFSVPLSKLEDEFRRLLSENCVVLDLSKYTKSPDADNPQDITGPIVIDLIKQEVIIQLVVIADRLRVNNRLDGCLDMYMEARGRMMKKSMASVKPAYLRHASAEAVRELKWEDVHSFLFSWMHDFTAVVRVLMVSERQLCKLVFAMLDPSSQQTKVFEDILKESKFTLFLTFVEEVARSHHRPEALLVGLLDLVRGLENLRRDIDDVFKGCTEILKDIVKTHNLIITNVRRAFWELAKNVETRKSDVPNDGGKDRNASFVVNYMGMLLRDYPDAMDLAFTTQYSTDRRVSTAPESLPRAVNGMMDALVTNLEERASNGYSDPILAHIFLMNNYRHVLVRLKECDGLSNCLGDAFVLEWRKKVDQNMRNYLKKSWEKVLALLSREGLSSGRNVSKDAASRVRLFNSAFEDTYRQQLRWVILEDQLRDTVRLAIINMLVPAYHSFINSYGGIIDENVHPSKRVVKYTTDALQNMVRDMFQGGQSRPLPPE
ncbi:hypothetical protein KP509_25G067800 [Ceratopteris richardii]|nr:hypothetical protein KP509_25G067800 [Ceratopteris richardii]